MPSPAQTLPPSILEPIIEYASGVERAIGHRIGTKLCCLNRSFLPFLAVCRDWRVYSRALFYQEALVLMDDELLDLHDHTHMLPGLTTAVKAGTAGLVKIAHVELPYSRVLDGAAATLFSSTHFAGTQFSSATQLLVVLNDNMYPRTMDSGTMAENVARFSAAITRLFPNVRDHLFYIGCYEYAPQREDLVDMIPAICKLSSGVSIIDLSHGIYEQDLLPKSNLKHIMFRSDQYTDAQMELVRRNSQSLECIHLVNIDITACLKLIQDPTGNPVVYPHVSTR
ncbi:hypothetical protein DL89DRAFT_292612 [Linderina pennispora]|uniref:F-box domain-containing protein n=1 Tax=Linderina pennispora TaxID=61395 RepID=A0A1Y1W8R9_9FUNG|nr:uncharacterized protein DL89DRAFT_292612 [Linderina pennispora]ORX69917.1 hypothetical protein DL89DRAFT_292612 [Linderina pennispora]